MQFNKRVAELYPEIFADNGGEATSFGTKWGSYQELHTLAQGDIRRFNEITELPMHQCYLYLAFESDKSEELRKRSKKK